MGGGGGGVVEIAVGEMVFVVMTSVLSFLLVGDSARFGGGG